MIKVRVTNKSEVKFYKKNFIGKMFSMDLLDESGEIRCAGFTEAVNKFYDLIEVYKLKNFYQIQNPILKKFFI